MRTPNRCYKIPPERQNLDVEPDAWEPEYQVQEARWKRKNRTARLKAKISRLTEQNKYLLAELRKTNEYYFNALQALAKKNDL